MIQTIFEKSLSYIIPFLAALAATLILTPLARMINTRLGMIDKPDPRRINKVPVARGGGIAHVIGVLVSYAIVVFLTGTNPIYGADKISALDFWALTGLSFIMAAIGFIDDKFDLNPKVKLLGQIIVAFSVWYFVDLGFGRLWPSIPQWVDCLITIFWIVGAVNAFNLIDGLDGLASGLALIATLGMIGSHFITNNPSPTIFYFAFAGGLVGFLRYNYNPATIFLGDSGSMFIGFILATMPLVLQDSNSFLVSVGMPVLAMGIPIFDTALAIVRRSVRLLLNKWVPSSNDTGVNVMKADIDHTHHRLLRAVGLNQRKAAFILYLIATFFVTIGLVGMYLKSRAGGVWLFAVAVASVVVFKDVARIELFDVGRVLGAMARSRDVNVRRRWGKLSVPFYVMFDIAVMIAVFFLCMMMFDRQITREALRIELPLRSVCVFVALVFFNMYRTAWSRAMTSNYFMLLFACLFGTAIGTVAIYYAPIESLHKHLKSITIVYSVLLFVSLSAIRLLRGFVRDIFYQIDSARLKSNPEVSRILVYGAGLRYRAYRRELVRNAANNKKIVVGLIDDDLILRGQYIGGVKIYGTLLSAPDIIKRLNVDTVVIACNLSNSRKEIAVQTLSVANVKIKYFSVNEEVLNFEAQENNHKE
jgi:UDP-N-acetylmuramyl pentapeptide phosphotransferase/UDP-N-acetylglucosamine-1-phosphate transferase